MDLFHSFVICEQNAEIKFHHIASTSSPIYLCVSYISSIYSIISKVFMLLFLCWDFFYLFWVVRGIRIVSSFYEVWWFFFGRLGTVVYDGVGGFSGDIGSSCLGYSGCSSNFLLCPVLVFPSSNPY